MKVSGLECSKKPQLSVPFGAGMETTTLHMLSMEVLQPWAGLTFQSLQFYMSRMFQVFGLGNLNSLLYEVLGQ